jgi:hypothetical protein
MLGFNDVGIGIDNHGSSSLQRILRNEVEKNHLPTPFYLSEAGRQPTSKYGLDYVEKDLSLCSR